MPVLVFRLWFEFRQSFVSVLAGVEGGHSNSIYYEAVIEGLRAQDRQIGNHGHVELSRVFAGSCRLRTESFRQIHEILWRKNVVPALDAF